MIFVLVALFSSACGSSRYAYFKDGSEVDYNNEQYRKDNAYCRILAETGTPPPVYKDEPSSTPDTITNHSGTITGTGGSVSYSGTSRTQVDREQEGYNALSNSLHNLGQKVKSVESYNSLLDDCMIFKGYEPVTIEEGGFHIPL